MISSSIFDKVGNSEDGEKIRNMALRELTYVHNKMSNIRGYIGVPGDMWFKEASSYMSRHDWELSVGILVSTGEVRVKEDLGVKGYKGRKIGKAHFKPSSKNLH